MNNSETRLSWFLRQTTTIVWCLVAYALSSGPVLAVGFWLRDKTQWDGFYWVMALYLPLIWPGHWQPFDAYLTWWVNLLGTTGPG